MRNSSPVHKSKRSKTSTSSTWERPPRLSLSFHFTSGRLSQIHLAPSGDGLVCHFVGANATQRDEIEAWMSKYLQGMGSPAPFLELPPLPPFHQKVLKVLQEIPFGTTASYQEVAAAAGSPRAARAVGSACHHNPFPLLIPCHRVIASNGQLGGYAYPLEIKSHLLTFEKSLANRSVL